ncbi:MAG: nuclear transport factor 2 family protein [Woeseiaceae bacterium]|nr:nuclear transport factor 2 family protein [Woeseiaceae bacterium]
MNRKGLIGTALVGLCLLWSGVLQAQDRVDDSADVWSIIEAQWNAEEKGDDEWIDRMLTDNFSGWPRNSPAPRNKNSTRMWDRFTDQQGSMVAHELYPLSITIHGDVAIAHYLYTSAYEDKDGEVEMTNGRYTDVLVRSEDGWRFIAWHGGDDE